MKTPKLLFIKIAIFLTMFSCQDSIEWSPEENGPPRNGIDFNIHAAKVYFESNAQDLTFLRFSDSIDLGGALSYQTPELIPEWSKAMISTNDQVTLVEIPIISNAIMISTTSKIENGRITTSRTICSTIRLIVARRKNGATDMFLVTLVPSLKNNPNPMENMKNFRYLGGGEFTGTLFCSTLEGKLIEACLYNNGKRTGIVEVATRKKLAAKNIHLNKGSYESIVLHQSIKTRSGTYQFDESGMCKFHPQYPDSDCPYCLDEAFVNVCQSCGTKLEKDETCSCKCTACGKSPCECCTSCLRFPCVCSNQKPCPYCNNAPCSCLTSCPQCRPGHCTACRSCNSHFCYGTCYNNPSPDPDPFPEPDPIPCTCIKCSKCFNCKNPKNSNCIRCTCSSKKISISVNSKTIELGEKIKISVTCNNLYAKCNYLAYTMSKDGVEKNVQSFNSNPEMQIEEMIRQPGKYKVYAEAQFDNDANTYYSNEINLTCIYPSVTKIKELAVVQSGMNTAWENTINSADEYGYQEYGGVVMIHTQPGRNGQYTFEPKAGNKTSYDKDIVDIELDWIDNSINDFRNGGDYCVMIFHTHPPLWHCTNLKTQRILGPSSPDLETHTNIPAIVYDFDNEKITLLTPQTHRNLCVKKEYVYGPERRSN